jgi:pimeloyl-ACP methyl ester carboxylesterase
MSFIIRCKGMYGKRLFTERDGARLFSTTLGTGPDVVLLHPTPVHHAFWLPVAELLAPHFRLTLMDLRGHGESSAGTGTITIERLAEDLRAVLLANTVKRAALVGCSIGGYLLYECWRRFPAQIAALAPVCAKPQPDTAASREKRQETMRAAQQTHGLSKIFDVMAGTLIGPTALQRVPEVRKTARAMMDSVTLDAFLAVQRGLMQRPDSVPTLASITVPVCAIAGGEDQTSTADEMRVIAEHVPDAEFHIIADAGHYAPLEQPREIAGILQPFLDRAFSTEVKAQKNKTRPVN